MKLLNLGCGRRFHKDWVNIDFISSDESILAHDLSKGIPFEDNSFDFVYHSHVLEHFSKTEAEEFIKECFRVLKVNGIIRIAVPDLEMIAKEYLLNLRLALDDDSNAIANYEWIKLELFDQMVRNKTGGEMAKYLFQEQLQNEDYVFRRIGEEGKQIRRFYLENLKNNPEKQILKTQSKKRPFMPFRHFIKNGLVNLLLKKESHDFKQHQKELEIGKFRTSGEIHQWMYDRYSLAKLLMDAGFEEAVVQNAITSSIQNWSSYGLESNNSGVVFKPDSLFMEAKKPNRL